VRRPLHAATEPGPSAVPRRGSDCAAPLFERGALRCSRHKGGCGTAVAALNAPQLNGVLAGPSPAGPDFPLRRCASRRPRFAPTGYRPRACDALAAFVDKDLGGAAKPWSGVRRQRHCAAPRNAGLVAARAQRALRSSDSARLFECSERSERSEFRDGPRDRVPQGSRHLGPTVAHERRRIPGRGFASLEPKNSRDHQR